MAVFTGSPSSSTQYLPIVNGSGSPKTAGNDAGGALRVDYFTYTHSATEGTGTGEINLVRLPPGRIRIFPQLSWLFVSDLEASSTIDVGYRSYTQPDGTVVVEDDNAFEDNRDTASADTAAVLEFGGDGTTAFPTTFNTRDGLTIFLSVDTGTILAGDTIQGWITYTQMG